VRPKKNRRAYEVSELNQIFAGGLYNGALKVKGQVLEAAYWLPLLGPFIGARIEELCQLRVQDVHRVNGVWCLRGTTCLRRHRGHTAADCGSGFNGKSTWAQYGRAS
jgi:integrase